MALPVKLYRVVGKGKDRRYIPIDLARRGRRSKEDVTGPFYLRYGLKYESVGPDFKAAVEAMQSRQATLDAVGSGVAVKPDGADSHGYYGVVSYFVTQRTKEIGIRVALGATTHTVVGMVLKQSLRLTAIGTVVGTGLAIGMSAAGFQAGLHARVRCRGLRFRRVAGSLHRSRRRIHPVPQGSSNRSNPDASLRLRNAALIGQDDAAVEPERGWDDKS
jgi:hypothetical protein